MSYNFSVLPVFWRMVIAPTRSTQFKTQPIKPKTYSVKLKNSVK